MWFNSLKFLKNNEEGWRGMKDHLFLYGPPGSGKSTLGARLAFELGLPFIDLDEMISEQAGQSIADIFASGGEASFRQIEFNALQEVIQGSTQVIALGGGALLANEARTLAEENGQVLCLGAKPEELLRRVEEMGEARPLLAGNVAERLLALLDSRAAHYNSFSYQIDTSLLPLESAVWQAQVVTGRFWVRGMNMEYGVRILPGGLEHLSDWLLEQGVRGKLALVSDENVAAHYTPQLAENLRSAGYEVSVITIPAGEQTKTIATVQSLWAAFAAAHLERSSTVLALGGGVVGDLTGFAAATFLRGIHWINLPTTLLAMVDSSLGGKTGFDLPEGKNLVGAFYAPQFVLIDPRMLATLPQREMRNGLAETIKHGVIGDVGLFELCEQGETRVKQDLNALVRRSVAVKVRVIQEDPYEHGVRQALNLGHTVGHGVELASGYQFSHGESVAIGMVVEAELAEKYGIAEPGMAARIRKGVQGLGLPVDIPADFPRERMMDAMQLDKKRAGGKVRFALPEAIGRVRVGVELPGWQKEIS